MIYKTLHREKKPSNDLQNTTPERKNQTMINKTLHRERKKPNNDLQNTTPREKTKQ